MRPWYQSFLLQEDENAYCRNMVYFVMERVRIAMGILRQPDNAGGDEDNDDDNDTL